MKPEDHEPCPDCRRDPELVWQADGQCYVRCPDLCRSTLVADDPDLVWGVWDTRAQEARKEHHD